MVSILKSSNKYLASGFWIFVIIGLCVMPTNPDIKLSWAQKIHFDKIAHFGVYAILAFLLMRDELDLKWSFMICFSLGILIEFVQHNYLQGRYFEFLDIIANIIGYFAGIVFFNLCKHKSI